MKTITPYWSSQIWYLWYILKLRFHSLIFVLNFFKLHWIVNIFFQNFRFILFLPFIWWKFSYSIRISSYLFIILLIDYYLSWFPCNFICLTYSLYIHYLLSKCIRHYLRLYIDIKEMISSFFAYFINYFFCPSHRVLNRVCRVKLILDHFCFLLAHIWYMR